MERRGTIVDAVRSLTKSLTFGPSATQIARESIFRFSAEKLSRLHNPKNIEAFWDVGGLQGLVTGLRSHRTDGIDAVAAGAGERLSEASRRPSSVSIATDAGLLVARRAVFGANKLPTRKSPTVLQLLWSAYCDRVLFLLTAAALISLAIGLYQTFTSSHDASNPPIEWVNAAAILIAITIIVLVSTVNDWWKWRQFRKLNEGQQEQETRVMRSGHAKLIARDQVVVGDVVRLESGDVVPADGILISGYDIACDESNATGESGLILKTPGDDVYGCLKDRNGPDGADVQPGLDPFMLAGTRVLEGVGSFLVTCTGSKSTYGRLLASLKYEEDPTPLQRRLGVLVQYMVYVGAIISGVLFLALLIRFFVGLPSSGQTSAEKGQAFLDILIISLTVLVIAMPEGVPLAATLSLAYATAQMMKEGVLVRQLKGCETMGNATSVCTDIVRTLTQNQMTVVAAMVGGSVKFQDQSLQTSQSKAAKYGEEYEEAAAAIVLHTPQAFVSRLGEDVKQSLINSIALNTTAFESNEDGTFIGAHTDTALLSFAKGYLGMGPLAQEKDAARVVQFIPFNAARQCMAVVVERPGSPLPFRVFVKGDTEYLLSKCARIIQDPKLDAGDREISAEDRAVILETINLYASQGLHAATLVYRDLPSFSVERQSGSTDPQITLNRLVQEMTFLAVFGMHDPLRPGLQKSVQQCRAAGITVRIVTGDSLLAARTIAEKCGIYTPGRGDLAMDGAEFRELDDEQMHRDVAHLKILARCSPLDKELLVNQLQRQKEIVAVTGYSTSDVPAMVAADVSLSMGSINGTEVARQASSMVLTKGDFTSIVNCVMWGRTVNSSVKKFLQFQISITITVAFIAFVSALSNADGNSVLASVQLMWVNLFQDTGALALATDRPQPRDLTRRPESRSSLLITVTMWKTIIGMSVFQTAATYILYFVGPLIFPSSTDLDQEQLSTLVFNAYVWMQILTIYNCRQYDNTLNVFEGMLSNKLFMAFSVSMIGIQILIIFFGGEAFPAVPLTGPQWATSVILGLLVLPVGVLLRCLPDWPLEWLGNILGKCAGRRVTK